MTEEILADIAIAPFEFKSPLMHGQMPLSFDLPQISGKLKDGGSLRWLLEAVVPALTRMHNTGVLDVRWLWEHHVEPSLKPSQADPL